MRAGVACLLLALAASLVACGEEDAAPAAHTDSPTPISMEEPRLTVAATAPPEPSATPATSLPEAADGFVWQQVPAIPGYGMPAYAVQVPLDWVTPALGGNPVQFRAPDSSSDKILLLSTRTTPENLGWAHPVLLDLPMTGSTCGKGKPTVLRQDDASLVSDSPAAEVIQSATYSWNVYYFSCSTRVTAASGQTPVPFDVRGAEVQVGDVTFSVVAFEPPGSAAAQVAFEQAVRSLRPV
jgi:hypothetical protein